MHLTGKISEQLLKDKQQKKQIYLHHLYYDKDGVDVVKNTNWADMHI